MFLERVENCYTCHIFMCENRELLWDFSQVFCRSPWIACVLFKFSFLVIFHGSTLQHVEYYMPSKTKFFSVSGKFYPQFQLQPNTAYWHYLGRSLLLLTCNVGNLEMRNLSSQWLWSSDEQSEISASVTCTECQLGLFSA